MAVQHFSRSARTRTFRLSSVFAIIAAAGIAAALALDEQKPVYDAPVSAIQKVLADTGVIIHFDDAWVPTDQTADTFAQTEGHL